MNQSRRNNPFLILLCIATATIISGCASQTFSLPSFASAKPDTPPPISAPTQQALAEQAPPPQYVPPPRRPMPLPPLPKTTKVTASGQGTVNYGDQMSDSQRHLMAQRAARVDAFRNLVEVVYGFKISGQTSVGSFVTKNDSIRSYVDSYMRGARVVNMTPQPNGIYEATVELELNNEFFESLMASINTPQQAPSSGITGCVGQGCAQPSAFSFTANP